MKKDGGAAFPKTGSFSSTTMSSYDSENQDGMTLRDWFAGQALASIPLRRWEQNGIEDEEIITKWARCAYLVADAMIKEREKDVG